VASPGDPVTRTTPHGSETVYLPAINLAHLTQIQVVGSDVKGFHVLPAGVTITSAATLVLPPGAVAVVDRHGTGVPGVQVRIVPRKVPNSGWDTLEALVEVVDGTGVVLASVPHKTFFPAAWTIAQVQEAILAAFVEAYQAGRGPLGRLTGSTPAGVLIEVLVRGTTSAAGTRLKEIGTANPRSGQTLTSSHQP
jgi:hypothetical protein